MALALMNKLRCRISGRSICTELGQNSEPLWWNLKVFLMSSQITDVYARMYAYLCVCLKALR